VAEDEIHRLELTRRQALENGIDDLLDINGKDLKRMEPEIHGEAALFSPSSGIFDSHGFMKSLYQLGNNNGMIFAANTPFIGR